MSKKRIRRWRWFHYCWFRFTWQCYRLKCRLFHRYNVVVCRSLPVTWNDRDHLMLYAAFQILEDFVKYEQGHFYENVYALYVTDCGAEDAREREEEWQRLRSLHAWWLERKNNIHFDDYEMDDSMLHELIDLRKLLWT